MEGRQGGLFSDSFLIPDPVPFSSFRVVSRYLPGSERCVFPRPPRRRPRLCPEVTLGGGVDLCSGVWFKRTSLCLSPGEVAGLSPG